MASLSYLILIVFLAYSNSSPVEKATRAAAEDYRLPQDVIGDSIHYDLSLSLGADLFDNNTFAGDLKLTFNVLKNTTEIKIHAGALVKCSSVTLQDKETESKIPLTNSEFVIDSDTEILTITARQNLESGRTYILNFVYNAALITPGLQGFYKSTYTTKDGDVVPLATTQFQTTYARRAFPCFDEPSFKATFDIKIRHISEYTALGNTNGTSQEDPTDSKFTTTTFVTTPKMPTYLIAFVVSDFTCSDSEGASVPHRICSRKDAESTRKVALDFGPQLVEALQNYTGVSYVQGSITKIDQAAIPDFSAGAMENWGMATYRETALLWDEVESTNRNKQSVVTIIAHELAHMWFGDLVTTHWWSDTFLNEGFATFFEFFAAHEVPATQTWELDKQFVILEIQPMLQTDTLKNSRPLSWPAFTQSEVSSRFGSVSYNKGGAVFRMVQHMMGTAKFKEGLTRYLEANKFGNAKPTDLWAGLKDSIPSTSLPSGETLDSVMKTWVELPGYPVLTVTADGSNIIVKQQRFYTDGTPVNDTERWFVPITYTTSSDSNKFEDTSTKLWFRPGEENATISLNNANDWIVLNNKEVGYYRVLYDDTLYKRISAALNKVNFDGIVDLNRAQLVDDIFNFVKADLKTYTDVLDFFRFLKQDASYYPWYGAFTAFNTIIPKLGTQRLREGIYAYILDLMETLLKVVPFTVNNDNDQIYTLKKILALTWACRLGGQDCADNAVAAFQTYKTTKQKPSSNLRPIIYCNGLRYSKNAADDWNFLWGEFLTTELATERSNILTGLGCPKDVTVLNGYLEKSITANSGLTRSDTTSVFSYVYSNNPEGVDVTFDFVAANYQKIINFYGNTNLLTSLIRSIATKFTRQEQAEKLEEFLKNPDLTQAVITAGNTALQTAKANIISVEDFEKELKLYFNIDDNLNGAAEFKLKFSLFNVVGFVFMYLALLRNY